MADSEAERYDKFVTRTLHEVQVGLNLDNGQEGSLKDRVSRTLTAANRQSNRSAAEKVIDGRFILGGDDASYLASGLAVLWSTVGTPVTSEDGKELSLAPAALYSPDAVNGIHRGLIAAMEKRNREMRDEAPSALRNLMKALLPLLPFLGLEKTERDELAIFLHTGKVNGVKDRNRLFRFLVDAKKKLDADKDATGHIPSSSLAFQIIERAKRGYEAARKQQEEAAEKALEAYTMQAAERKKRLEAKIRKRDARLEEMENDIEEMDRDAREEQEKMQARIAALTQERDERAAEMSELKKQLDFMTTRRRNLKAETLRLQKVIEKTKSDAAAAAAAVARAAADLEAASAVARAAQAKAAKEALQRQADEKNAEVARLNQELTASREELARMQQRTAADEEAIRTLEGKLAPLEEDVRQKKKLIDECLKKVKSLQTKKAQSTEDVEAVRSALQAQIASLEASQAVVERELEAAQNAEGRAKEALRANEESREELVNRHEAEIKAKNAELERAAEEWLKDLDEKADVKQRLEEAERQLALGNGQDVADLRARNEELQNANEELRSANEELLGALKQARTERDVCRADLEAAEGRVTEAGEARQQAEAKVLEAQAETRACAERLEEAKTQHDALEAQLADAKAAGGNAETQIAELEAELSASKAAREQCAQDLAEARSTLQAREAEKEVLDAKVADLSRERDAAATELAKHEAQSKALTEQLTKQSQAAAKAAAAVAQTVNHQNAQNEVDDAREQLQIAEEKLAELEQPLQKLRQMQTQAKEKLASVEDELPTLQNILEITSDIFSPDDYAKAKENLEKAQTDKATLEKGLEGIAEGIAQNQPAVEAQQAVVKEKQEALQQAEKKLYDLVAFQPLVQLQGTQASSGDAWINAAIFRGLVGQRGPTEPASVAACPQDALLPYALPDVKQVVKHLLPAHLLLQSTPDPTAADLERAMGACAACAHADKRQRLSADVASPATTSEALALFEDDFAITGEVPAAELPDERHGVELPHEVRWMPQGPRAHTMARVAVMEHAVARCAQLAAKPDVRPEVAAALRHAGAALKLQQLAPLYELHAAAENDDEPHPLGTNGRRLVTRPCAVVRGMLSFPVDAGVVPLTEAQAANGNDKPLTKDASLAQAVNNTAARTAALRNDLRKRGLAHNVYVAPEAHELAFRSAPTGDGNQAATTPGVNDPGRNAAAGAARAAGGQAAGARAAAAAAAATPPPIALSSDGDADTRAAAANGDAVPTTPTEGPVTLDAAPVDLYRDETFARIINRLIVATAALQVDGDPNDNTPDPVQAFLEANNPAKGGEALVTPQTRREGLWNEMHRHVAISQDRLWVFVRLMSGKIGGNVSEVITLADEATLKAAKAIQEQRLEVSKRVSDTQAKIVETVVASMLKNSRMTMEYVQKDDDKKLAVIDAEARKELKDLQTGASGRPFFEANVALKNLTQPDATPPKLQEVLSGLAEVGKHMQSALEQTLAEPGAASASLIELSHPSNSYFVSMRADAVAAIREAQEKLNCELGALGGRRRLMLWELVEGGCTVLVQRFAELCGYLLVQARTSTGVSAMYVSHQNIYTNASQARISLAKLTAAACEYLGRVPAPKFDSDAPKEARFVAISDGEKVRDIDVTARRVPMPIGPLRAHISSSGWWNEGGRRYS
jgi:hypothetical protein